MGFFYCPFDGRYLIWRFEVGFNPSCSSTSREHEGACLRHSTSSPGTVSRDIDNPQRPSHLQLWSPLYRYQGRIAGMPCPVKNPQYPRFHCSPHSRAWRPPLTGACLFGRLAEVGPRMFISSPADDYMMVMKQSSTLIHKVDLLVGVELNSPSAKDLGSQLSPHRIRISTPTNLSLLS